MFPDLKCEEYRFINNILLTQTHEYHKDVWDRQQFILWPGNSSTVHDTKYQKENPGNSKKYPIALYIGYVIITFQFLTQHSKSQSQKIPVVKTGNENSTSETST